MQKLDEYSLLLRLLLLADIAAAKPAKQMAVGVPQVETGEHT